MRGRHATRATSAHGPSPRETSAPERLPKRRTLRRPLRTAARLSRMEAGTPPTSGDVSWAPTVHVRCGEPRKGFRPGRGPNGCVFGCSRPDSRRRRSTPVARSEPGTTDRLVRAVVPKRRRPQRCGVPRFERTGGQRARAQPACELGGTEQNGTPVEREFDESTCRGERSAELRSTRGTSKGNKAQGGSGRAMPATVCRFHGPLDGATPWSRGW